MKSEILIGVWGGASTSFCCRQEARECTFSKCHDTCTACQIAKRKSVATLALLAKTKLDLFL